MYAKNFLIFILAGFLVFQASAQKKHVSLKDTLDNKLDLSDFLINMHGFIPVPVIISEPALGNFGGALALVFISPKKGIKGDDQFHFPDINAVAGMYTLNNSWGTAAIRQGSFPKIGMRYRAALGYASVNLNFYREIPHFGEQEFLFTLKPFFVMLDASENIYRNRFFAGLNYLFTNVKTSYNFENLPDSVFNEQDFNKNIGVLSFYGEFDSRNSIFTPDKGLQVKATAGIGRNWTGCDFDEEKFDFTTLLFFQPLKPWVSGFKVQYQWISDDVPFYLYPFLTMRGIPLMRYQGQSLVSFETEQRVDITRRWSLVGFVGTGRTFSDSKYMEDEQWHWGGGGGFRYLVSRLFKIRMGVDIAAGPDQMAYYIVFGHYWSR